MLPEPRVLRDTVVSFPPTNSSGPALFIIDIQRGPILAPRGSKWREAQLRYFDHYDFSALWQGARSGVIKKLSNVGWKINGPPSQVQYYQDVLGNAHFGHGWEYLLKLGIRDFLTQGYGAIFEIAGPGDPLLPLIEAPTGLNHLDAGRCYVTGNPIYPLLYYSLWDGKLHKMHASRVYMMVDDPDPDERYFGIGTCALERAIAVNQREIRMGQYVDSLLDDKPQPGLLSLTGVSENNWQALVANYLTQQQNDGRPVFGRTLVLTSIDPNANVKAEVIPFAQTPEKFDFQKYTDLDVSALALALGIDRQELWELAGRGIGSGSQSAVLAMKSRAKLYGDVLTGIERFMNWAFLPDDCEFEYVEHDAQQDVTQTAIDLQLAQLAQTLAAIPGISPLEIKKLLAARSDTFKDAMTDDMGRIVVVSEDPKPSAQIDAGEPSISGDTPVAAAPQASGPPASAAPKIPSGQLVAQQTKATGEEEDRSDRFAFEEYEIVDDDSTEEKKFDPNQTRDDSGKWSETGGGSGSKPETGKPSKSPREKPSSQTKPANIDYDLIPETVIADTWQPSAPKPSPGEAAALEHYRSVSGNYAINKPLRTGGTLNGTTKKHVKQLDAVLSKAKLDRDAVLYRGIEGNSLHMKTLLTDLDSGRIKPGVTIRDNGFASTSLSKNLAESKFSSSGGAVFKIHAAKGSNGLYMNASMDKYEVGGRYEHEFRDEKEVLLPRGANFRVKTVRKLKSGYEIDLEYDGYSSSILKAFSVTSADFRNHFADIVTQAVNKQIRRNQAENLLLGLLLSSGTKAFADGLNDGGVSDEITPEDSQEIQNLVADAIDYLDPFLAEVDSGNVTVEDVNTRAEMWSNKTLTDFYTAGKASADDNGMYEWVLGDTDHCEDCLRLSGQRHRFGRWYETGWLPQGEKIACRGYRCKCRLVKTSAPAQGRF